MQRAGHLREFWRYRELLYFLVWRDLKVRYKQTKLGAAWAILQPFVTMIIFTIFFGRLAGIPSDDIPRPIFYYSALLPWTYFASALTGAGNSLLSNSDLLTKVYFPRLALPVAAVLTGLIDFAIASVVLIGMMAYYAVPVSWELLLWPLLLLPLTALALGLGTILAALNVNFRDVKHALPFCVQLLLFLTPIIYPASMVPQPYRSLLALNPLTGIIEAFRAALIPGRAIDWGLLGISAVTTTILLVIGLTYFRRTEREFADII
ncbi:MAG: ABC transporter permease [Planctomycetota bacterium]|nr:ABC transporter permease [Planctomycetota bacterium]